MRRDLPEGWASCQLGALVTPSKKRAEPGETKGRRYIGLEHIEGGTNRIIGHGASSEVKSTTTTFSEGDVLFSKLRPYLNKVAVAPFEGVGSTEILVFKKCSYLESKYLMWLLSRDEMVRIANGRAAGVQLPRITFEKVADVEVPVAPLREQRRIVERVEALLEQIDRASPRLDRVSLILKRFRQAVLASAVSGRLTVDWRDRNPHAGLASALLGQLQARRAKPRQRSLRGKSDTAETLGLELPDTWVSCPVHMLCQQDRSLTYGVIKLGKAVAMGVPTLRSSDVRALRIDRSHVKAIDPKIAAQYSRTTLGGGEVLVTVRGSLGGVAVVPDDMADHNISREVAVLPLERAVSAHYVALAIASGVCQDWLLERTKGVAYTGINIEDLRLLPLPTPPRPEQDEIVRRVDALFDLAELVEARVRSTGEHRLTEAVLGKAFRGELVPTEAELAAAEGRNYETATELLERIRRERGDGASAEGHPPHASSRGRGRARPLAASSALGRKRTETLRGARAKRG